MKDLPNYIDLEDLRSSIDLLDSSLMHLLAERTRAIIKVGLIKKSHDLPSVYSEKRKHDLAKIEEIAVQGQLSRDFVEKLFDRIYQEAINIIEHKVEANDMHDQQLDPELILADLRRSLFNIDIAICHILMERFRVVLKVGHYKKIYEMPPLAKQRWQQVLSNKIETAKKLNIAESFIEDLFNLIHDEALKLERNEMG